MSVTNIATGKIYPEDLTLAGRRRSFYQNTVRAANAGAFNLAQATFRQCIIDSIILRCDAVALTADLTSCAVTGDSGQVTFIPASVATQANLSAKGKQVAWVAGGGGVEIDINAYIVMTLVGTGSTAVDIDIIINYHAAVDGGYLV